MLTLSEYLAGAARPPKAVRVAMFKASVEHSDRLARRDYSNLRFMANESRAAFDRLDGDNNEALTWPEISKGISENARDLAPSLHRRFDIDKQNEVDANEFLITWSELTARRTR